MSSFSQVGTIIQLNLGTFTKPGVLAVRPGYKINGGWPVGDPIIVVLVADKKGDAQAYGLPATLGGVAIEIREAAPLERMKAIRPETYAMLKERTPAEEHQPDFPFQYSVVKAAPEAPAAAAAAAAKQQIDYVPAAPPLDPITDNFTVICNVSPDAGWPTLNAFFSRIQAKLSVSMYDFTSAHILTALDGALTAQGATQTLSLTLDDPKRNPTADQTDEQTEQNLSQTLNDKFSFAWAPVRSSPEVHEWMFPSAYHIKVAVRDSQELWLSSGNWNNSNQPELAPADDPDPASAAQTFKKSDRDWHVVILHPGLAQLLEAFLINDRETAQPAQGAAQAAAMVSPELEAFAEMSADLVDVSPAAVARAPQTYFQPQTITAQMTIQPLLTPDKAADGQTGMYSDKMMQLIAGAQQSLYIQLQYIHPSNSAQDAAFNALIDAVQARIAAGVDVRIILSQWQNAQWMERLQAAGLDTSKVRIQNGVHNKGFVVDHQTVVISSQNWSGDGVLRNRDAGLIVESAQVAQYFEPVFLEDWDNLATSPSVSAAAVAEAPAPPPQIYRWQDDPGESIPAAVPPEPCPVPVLNMPPLPLVIPGIPQPAPGLYSPGTPEFRYWTAAEAAARGAAFWSGIVPPGTTWQTNGVLPLLLDAGQDFNAYYDRKALNFFHGTQAGRTVYSGESPDVVCHEEGHAILDALRPQLWNAGSIEAAAFHEGFADICALLAALQLPAMRAAVLAETGGNLSHTSRLSRLAEQLGWAIRQFAPTAVEPDCLRNASNSFFYANPETLPTSAPAATLSSEPHSFSRVFSGAFLDALAGGARLNSAMPSDDDLVQVSFDFARLLAAAVTSAPVVPEYMSQVAAAMVAADASNTQGKYGDVLRSAFVRHGILSQQSAVGLAGFQAANVTATAPWKAAAPVQSWELPAVAISAAEYGLGDRPLLVRMAAEPRRFSVTAAAFGVGTTTPSNSEHAARAFVEDLLQRGHLDVGQADISARGISHPNSLKTHHLVASEEGMVLTRILFDCGFSCFR